MDEIYPNLSSKQENLLHIFMGAMVSARSLFKFVRNEMSHSYCIKLDLYTGHRTLLTVDNLLFGSRTQGPIIWSATNHFASIYSRYYCSAFYVQKDWSKNLNFFFGRLSLLFTSWQITCNKRKKKKKNHIEQLIGPFSMIMHCSVGEWGKLCDYMDSLNYCSLSSNSYE